MEGSQENIVTRGRDWTPKPVVAGSMPEDGYAKTTSRFCYYQHESPEGATFEDLQSVADVPDNIEDLSPG